MPRQLISRSVYFSADGTFLVSGSVGGIMEIWDVKNWTVFRTCDHQRLISSVAFSPDKKLLAAGSERTTYIWDIETWTLRKTITNNDLLYSAAFSPDGALLVSGAYNKIFIRDPETWTELKILTEHKGHVHSVAFSPDGKLLAFGSKNTINIWERASLLKLRQEALNINSSRLQ